MELSWNFDEKLLSICDEKCHGISMRIRVIFFTGFTHILLLTRIFSCLFVGSLVGMTQNPHGKSHHFLRKCCGYSMTQTSVKSMSCFSMENK